MPSFVQNVRSVDQYGDPVTVSVSAIGAGNTLCVAVKAGTVPTGVTCGSDTLTLRESISDGDGNSLTVWDKLDCTGGGSSVSIDFSSGTFVPIVGVFELSGVDSAGPSISGTGSGASATVSFTTAIDSASACGIVANDILDYSLTPVSGYTATPGTAAYAHIVYNADVGTAGSKSFGGTWSASPAWELIGRAYYPSSGGPPPSPSIIVRSQRIVGAW